MGYKYILISVITLLASLYFFTSYIHSSGVKNDETMVFLPTYAYVKDTIILARIHAWVFELEENSVIRKWIISGIENKLSQQDKTQFRSKLFKEKIRYFMVDNERNKNITITLNNKKFKLQQTRSNGHSNTTITIRIPSKKQHLLLYSSHGENKKKSTKRSFKGSVCFIPETGISVISDIDDTIKHSNVLHKKELLKNTFLRPYKPVTEMPALYKEWQAAGCAFHYVSGSPWQLYIPIKKFFNKYAFPQGSVHLKYLRIKDRTFIKFIWGKQKEYKLNEISQIINDFPKRKFVLVGDSGEQDPEIYTEINKRYPDNIIGVYIRDMGNFTPESKRYQETLKYTGKEKLVVFKTGSDLRNKADLPINTNDSPKKS